MSFLLISPRKKWTDGDEALMEKICVVAGLRDFQRVSRLCPVLAHPVTEFLGRLNGHDVIVGGDLLMNTTMKYMAHICITGKGSNSKANILLRLASTLESAGFDATLWSSGVE